MSCIELPTVHSFSFLCGVSLVITLPKIRREEVFIYCANSQLWNVHRKALVFPAKAVFTFRKDSRPRELRSPHFVVGYVARQYQDWQDCCVPAWSYAMSVGGLKSCRRDEELGWESVIPGTTQRTLLLAG